MNKRATALLMREFPVGSEFTATDVIDRLIDIMPGIVPTRREVSRGLHYMVEHFRIVRRLPYDGRRAGPSIPLWRRVA